jgi:gas vesicle protein
MANGYDRFDNEGSSGGSFVMGLLTGTVLGAGLGLLFAPKAGSELRGQISEQASHGYRKATEAANEWAERGKEAYGKATDAANQWAERGKDAYSKARDAASKGVDEAQHYIRETADSISETTTQSTTGSSGSRLS